MRAGWVIAMVGIPVLTLASVAGTAPCLAQSSSATGSHTAELSDLSAQAVRVHPRRARPRIVIRRRPGEKIVRQCEGWLAQEVWPNGHTYIVPRRHCWWSPHPPP